jgi:hypothetical protein
MFTCANERASGFGFRMESVLVGLSGFAWNQLLWRVFSGGLASRQVGSG